MLNPCWCLAVRLMQVCHYLLAVLVRSSGLWALPKLDTSCLGSLYTLSLKTSPAFTVTCASVRACMCVSMNVRLHLYPRFSYVVTVLHLQCFHFGQVRALCPHLHQLLRGRGSGQHCPHTMQGSYRVHPPPQECSIACLHADWPTIHGASTTMQSSHCLHSDWPSVHGDPPTRVQCR